MNAHTCEIKDLMVERNIRTSNLEITCILCKKVREVPFKVAYTQKIETLADLRAFAMEKK